MYTGSVIVEPNSTGNLISGHTAAAYIVNDTVLPSIPYSKTGAGR
ncbi:hypothetical protein GWI33_010311, partial [Rhynchophorus ferrugineus]